MQHQNRSDIERVIVIFGNGETWEYEHPRASSFQVTTNHDQPQRGRSEWDMVEIGLVGMKRPYNDGSQESQIAHQEPSNR